MSKLILKIIGCFGIGHIVGKVSTLYGADSVAKVIVTMLISLGLSFLFCALVEKKLGEE